MHVPPTRCLPAAYIDTKCHVTRLMCSKLWGCACMRQCLCDCIKYFYIFNDTWPKRQEVFWSAAHTQTRRHTHRDTHTDRQAHTYIERHTHTEGHTHHGRLTPVSFCKQRTSTSRACHSCLPLPPLHPHPLPLLPPATATKLDDFQLCSTSLPPLPHDVASESSFSFFFILALLATVGNVFTVNRGHLHTHTRTHTCNMHVHIKFYYCHFPWQCPSDPPLTSSLFIASCFL